MLIISKFGTLPVAVLAIIILGELATQTIMTSMMTPTAFAQPTQQQQRQSSTNGDISVLSSSVERTGFGFNFIIGEIRNDSPEAVVGTVTIVASFYDSGGNLIDTSSTFAELQQLRPGEESPFRMAISDESILERMDNYTLSVEANPVFGGVKPAALRVDVSEQRLNEFDQYEIVGQVTNTGNRDTSLVQVIANFYDETGRLIDTQFTFLASDLLAGQSGPFKITALDGERANEAASVRLITESTDYVMIDSELELQQQQQQQSLQEMSQQQNETAMIAPSSSQTTTEPLSTNAATSGSNIDDSSDGGIDAKVINQLTARAISYAEQANTALQSSDIEGASRNLNFALNELENIQGNLTSSTSGSNSVDITNGDSSASSQTTTPSTLSSQPQQQQQPPSSPSPFPQQLQSQQQEQEEGPPQQQSVQQEQNEGGGATVSIVEGSSSLTTDAYSPNPVQVSVGGTVTWTNDDAQPHTVTSGENATPDGDFDSGIMAPEATFEHTFTEAGEYPYFCLLHPNQVGTVSVS
jgi:plastocyanin